MPTSSPRAWAGDDITIPAPMVTAKAAAILNDIALSVFADRPLKEVGLPVSRTHL
jgi:hypothetical protein